MKANVNQIVNAYEALESIETKSLEVEDIMAILSVRRALRPIKEDFAAFMKDASEKFKPANIDELVEIEKRWDDATEEEKVAHNKDVAAYHKAIADAVNAEYADDIDIEAKLPDEVAAKVAKMKEWTIEQLDVLSILM